MMNGTAFGLRRVLAAMVVFGMCAVTLLDGGVAADERDDHRPRYKIAIVDGTDGDFPPWDVIDLNAGRNIGLNREIVEAACDANRRMKCRIVERPYADCITGDPNIFGGPLGSGRIDGCLAWFQSDRRAQIGAEFSTAIGGAALAVLIRSDVRGEPLPDTDDAIMNLSIGVVDGFAADRACLEGFYPTSTGVAVDVRDENEILSSISNPDAGLVYAWVLVPSGDIASFVLPDNTSIAHESNTAKSLGTTCGAGLAMIVNPESRRRADLSSRLRIDFNCGMALLAAASERGVEELTGQSASNHSESLTDFQRLACGGDEICALDSEIPLPTIACLTAQEKRSHRRKRHR